MNRKPELIAPSGLEMFKRIYKLANERGVDLQTVAMRFALERFLARVFSHPDTQRLLLNNDEPSLSAGMITLKGGLTMCFAEDAHPLDSRSTSDADFHVPNFQGDIEDFGMILRKILAEPLPDGQDDGIRFDLDALKVARVKEGRVPGGSVTIPCQIGKMPLLVRTDLAFDSRPVYELATVSEYPSVLPETGLPAFQVRRTPFSYTVADKLQAMIRHGAGNYRVRDYYDLYVILSKGKADLDQVPEAIRETFELYGSEIPDSVADMQALSQEFAAAKAERWDIERQAKNYGAAVPEFPEVVRFIRETIEPLLEQARRPGPVL